MVARHKLNPEPTNSVDFNGGQDTTIHPRPRRAKTGGRVAGTPNKTTQRKKNILALRYECEDILPHEFLLKIVRGHQIEVTPPGWTGAKKFAVPTLQQRIDAANKAAPYYAPRLSTVEVIQGISDNDLDQIIAGAAAAAGISITTGPDGSVSIQALAQAFAGTEKVVSGERV